MSNLHTIPFADIQTNEILQLLNERVPELKTLDYKRQPIGDSDREKREFSADVSSFANASGGNLIFGIEEENGVPTKIVGMGSIDTDAEILRLESIIQSRVEPRIQGVQSKSIEVPGHGSVLIMRIPRSWASPHMVKDSGRFYSRNSRGKYMLDVQEIRSAFALSENVSDRIRKFRSDRIAKIIEDETPVDLEQPARIILQLIPVVSFDPGYQANLPLAMNLPPKYLVPLGATGCHTYPNFDGILTHDFNQETKKAWSYLQLFRNGVIETVDSGTLGSVHKTFIPNVAFDSKLIERIPIYFGALEKIGVTLPIVVALTLVGVKGFRMDLSGMRSGRPIDRDVLRVPELLADSYTFTDLQTKSLLDPIWNAAGFGGCLNVNGHGDWIGR